MTNVEKYAVKRFLNHNKEEFIQYIIEECMWGDGTNYQWLECANSNEELENTPIEDYLDKMRQNARKLVDELLEKLN